MDSLEVLKYIIEAIAVKLGERINYGEMAVKEFTEGRFTLIDNIGIKRAESAEKLIDNAKKRLAEICGIK